MKTVETVEEDEEIIPAELPVSLPVSLPDVNALRRKGYEEESDHLGWKYLAGEIDKSVWEAARKRVQEKYPTK